MMNTPINAYLNPVLHTINKVCFDEMVKIQSCSINGMMHYHPPPSNTSNKFIHIEIYD